MTSAQEAGGPARTLRSRLQELQQQGASLNMNQAVGLIVPLCVELSELHRSGAALFVHPSALVEDDYGFYHVDTGLAAQPPSNPEDIACIAPEVQEAGQPGDARASVYAAGAILYELLTNRSVGPGMKRPSELVPGVPPATEVVMSKALVADPAHRPDDLSALAQALYQTAPTGSIRPPAADTSHLDHDEHFEVDISMSLMPPTPAADMSSPYGLTIQEAPAPSRPRGDEKTNELADVKARLEADPRPRYVVIKDGMDHGPFSAVELLQQLASHTFTSEDRLRDSVANEEREIGEWPDFAPFAEQAQIHRNIKDEKDAIERVVVEEARSTRGKAFIGIGVVGVLMIGAGIWFLTARGQKSDEIAVHGDTTTSVDTDAGLEAKKATKSGQGRPRGQGNYPALGGGMSCEQARASYVEQMTIGGKRGPADLTAGQYGAILNRGGYLTACGVPESMKVTICAAVQNGRAVGVTVRTQPSNPRIQGCVAGQVRRISFPSHPKLDVTTTVF